MYAIPKTVLPGPHVHFASFIKLHPPSFHGIKLNPGATDFRTLELGEVLPFNLNDQHAISSNSQRRYNSIKVLDWNQNELETTITHGLHYTIRSSKYPRTVQSPRRTIITLGCTHSWSIHTYLAQKFSTKLAHLIRANPSLETIKISPATTSIANPEAWEIFLSWLYILDKIPLPDYTPRRAPHWTKANIKDACLLASWLHAPAFEKYLFRIVFRDVAEGRFEVGLFEHLVGGMTSDTGLHWFGKAFLRWKREGYPRELDPYGWRVEHWYGQCGRGGNWGCFHGMGEKGWAGVWERQDKVRESWRGNGPHGDE